MPTGQRLEFDSPTWWEQWRGQRWAVRRWFEDQLGDAQMGRDQFLLAAHRFFRGNGKAAAEFLGFETPHLVREQWRRIGLESLGKEYPRRGEDRDRLRTPEELHAHFLELASRKEMGLTYHWALPRGAESAHLTVAGDIHAGNPLFRVDILEALRDWIAERPAERFIICGDLFDLNTKTSVGSVGERSAGLAELIDWADWFFRPIWGQCIGIGLGNHDGRIDRYQDVGWNPVRELCERVTAQGKHRVNYLGYAKHIALKIGRQTYRTYYHHGKGGAATPGGRINAVRDIVTTVTADIVITAHLHDELSKKFQRRDHDLETDEIGNVEQQGIMCPSFLDYGNYAQQKALPPSPLGATGIEFDAKRKAWRVVS